MDNKQLINGPAGHLEMVVSEPQASRPDCSVAVICHPHPLKGGGGSMTNKVVHILASSFRDMGVVSVRFNFRGVGQSEGEFDNGEGETQDMLAVVKWVRTHYPDAPLWLCGFSFGAYVALKGHVSAAPDRLLLIAPPVTMYSFAALPPVRIPWMVIQGGQDEVTPAEAVSAWAQQQNNPPRLVMFDDAGHFFHGRLNLIRETVKQTWATEM